MKTVSQLDADGFFLSPVIADASPLEPGVFLIPAGAVDRAPPAVVEPGKRYRPWGAGWRGEVPPEPALPVLPSAAELRRGEIAGRLAEIDSLSARALRESVIQQAKGKPVPAFSLTKLESLETEAAALRAELAALQ